MKLACEVCHKPMEAQRRSKRFCSARCRTAANRALSVTSVESGIGTRSYTNGENDPRLTRHDATACHANSAGTPLPDLLRHLENHYAAYQLEHDLDCILVECQSDADRRSVIKAARAKAKRFRVRSVSTRTSPVLRTDPRPNRVPRMFPIARVRRARMPGQRNMTQHGHTTLTDRRPARPRLTKRLCKLTSMTAGIMPSGEKRWQHNREAD